MKQFVTKHAPGFLVCLVLAQIAQGIAKFFPSIGAALFAVCLGAGGTVYVVRQRKRAVSYAALIVGALAAFAAYLFAALLPWRIPALVCACACGFFVGILSPGAMSAAGRGLPAAGGWMLASLAVAQDIGAALLPSAGSALAENFSVRACFLVLSAAPLFAAVFLALMARARAEKGGLPLTFREILAKRHGNDRQ